MVKSAKADLVWIDLEMTGLDFHSQRIIEVAALITDWDFKPRAEYHAIIHQPAAVMSKMDDWCKVQHGKSGLTEAVKSGKSEKLVEKELAQLVKKYCNTPAILAGSSVHFDRRFITKYWPKFESLLHYRILDVSAWKVVMLGKYGIKFNKREAHRAVDDIKGSIEELQYYLAKAKFKK